jgi:hypothetical protein
MLWTYEFTLASIVLTAVSNIPMITVMLVVIALLWAITMFFERIVQHLNTTKQGKLQMSSAGKKTKKKSVAEDTTVLPTTEVATKKMKKVEPDSLMGSSKGTGSSNVSKDKQEEGEGDDEEEEFDDPDVGVPQDDDDDDDEDEADQEDEDEDEDEDEEGEDEEEDQEGEDSQDDDDALKDDSLLDDEDEDGAGVIVSSMNNQLSGQDSWETGEIEYEPLDLMPGAVMEEDLAEVLANEPEPEPVLLATYVNRMDIIKTAAYDLGRLVRKRGRRVQTEQVAERLVGMINHFKMNADRNVGDLFRMEATRQEDTEEAQEDRFMIFARMQNASLTE